MYIVMDVLAEWNGVEVGMVRMFPAKSSIMTTSSAPGQFTTEVDGHVGSEDSTLISGETSSLDSYLTHEFKQC